MFSGAAALTAERREQLILEHLSQVKLIARRIHDRIPSSISLDDLISAGVLGLISAIDRFDERHDVKLKTYAEYKIRGAILDSLRGMDWAPRQHRRRSRLVEQAIGFLEQSLQRIPEEDEIAEYLGLSVSTYHEWLSDDDSGDLLQYVDDSEESWPSELLERAELERALTQAIERIPKVERTVLSLYFYEEMTLREIAKLLDLHESRISQIKPQAILRLRSFVQRRWKF